MKVLYTNFTAVRDAGGRKKTHLMPLVDHATKWGASWALGYHPNPELALECLSMAHTNLVHVGLTLEDRIIHHDQDSVYIRYRRFTAVLIRHRARISFSENGARGNTAMESFNGRFKGESKSLFHEAANIWELKRIIAEQTRYHNCRRRNSALGYQLPIDYLVQEEILSQSAVALGLQPTQTGAGFQPHVPPPISKQPVSYTHLRAHET